MQPWVTEQTNITIKNEQFWMKIQTLNWFSRRERNHNDEPAPGVSSSQFSNCLLIHVDSTLNPHEMRGKT